MVCNLSLIVNDYTRFLETCKPFEQIIQEAGIGEQ